MNSCVSRFGTHIRTTMLRLLRSEAGAMLFLFTAAALLLRLAGNIVLTRLLDPHAFGIVGVIISVMMVVAMISDLGVLDFVVRHPKGGDARLLDVIWTIRLGQSALQSLAMVAGAWPIASLLGKPELALPIAWTAPLFLLNAFCPMSIVLAQRQGRLRATCAVELISTAVQIATNVALTQLLPDYRALIVGLYAGAAARILLVRAIFEGQPRLLWDSATGREFMGFSRWILPSTLLTLILTQADKFLFARLFSVADFGVYMLPANLALALQPFGRNYVERFFFPLISRTWHAAPQTLGTIFYSTRRRFYLMLFAGTGLGVGGAPALFRLLFDQRYEYGWIYFSVLLLRTALNLDAHTNVQTMLAIGRTAPVLRANIARLLAFGMLVIMTFRPLGPIALPLSLAGAELAALAYGYALLRDTGLLRLGEQLAYYAALGAAMLAGAAVSLWLARDVIAAGLAVLG